MSNRKIPSRIQQQQDNIRQGVRKNSAVDFFSVLTGPLLLDLTEGHLPEHRERLYQPTVVLSMFIQQALENQAR